MGGRGEGVLIIESKFAFIFASEYVKVHHVTLASKGGDVGVPARTVIGFIDK